MNHTKITFFLLFFLCSQCLLAQIAAPSTQVSVTTLIELPREGDRPVSLSELPNGNLVFHTLGGDIYEIVGETTQKIYTVSDHQLSYVSHSEVKGDLMYLCGSVVQEGDSTMIGYVMQGNIVTGEWRVLAESVPHYTGLSFKDHRFSSLLVSLDGEDIYVHCGTRTNTGEIQELSGVPGTIGLRTEPIRGKLFKLPTNQPETLIIPNDSLALIESGFQYVEGLRHLFAMAWGTDGNFYGGSNSDRRDVAEAFYKIEAGKHYGFPWWIGGESNALLNPDYNPNTDRLLPSNANNQGYYNRTPNFPPLPENIDFIQPYKNVEPDGDKYREATNRAIKDGSDEGKTITSFTAHRSPTGLIFDRNEVLPSPFTGDGFMVSYTKGGNLLADDGHDLLQITLLNGDTLSATRLVTGFIHPIDVMQKGNALYVLDLGNSNGTGRAIYKIGFQEVITSIAEIGTDDIAFFPNPTTGEVNIQHESTLPITEILIYNHAGYLLKRIQDGRSQFDIRELPAQVYLVKVQFSDATFLMKKLIKVGK